MEIEKTQTKNKKPIPEDHGLGFGQYTTDHMFLMDFTAEKGWHRPRIVPYSNLSLDPAAMIFHYNQEVFEGLKAYSLPDTDIGLFRPEKNLERLNRSAKRMVMPTVPKAYFLQALKELILIDRDWVPTTAGTSLYIRPTMIATEAALGVRPSKNYLFYIILSPVGAYYPQGFNPTRIFVSDDYVRAVQGGAGEAKTSGNYGPTLYVSKEAAANGYAQVLWLDGKKNKYVEEVGTSNIFFHLNNELITPPINGTILPGITRDSVLHLAREWGLPVSERRISIEEVVQGIEDGSLKEVFASGTAAVISPVGEIGYRGTDRRIADGQTGDLARRFYEEITGIQYGRKPDPFGWRRLLSELVSERKR
ncbi:MAG: branched-chain amino acid aminotransferase [Thermodesulfobacteriota bacterium]